MKQKLLIGLFIIFSIKSLSQESKFSIEANYPLPIGDNFISENYGGIIDFGVKYKFSDLKMIKIGFSINGGYYKNSKASPNNPYDLNLYAISPRLFTEFGIKSLNKIKPSAGIGYSFMVFKVSGMSSFEPFFAETTKSSNTDSGLNLNLALDYELTDKLFIQIQYDFIKIVANNDIPNTKYNTNIQLLKFGLGYKL